MSRCFTLGCARDAEMVLRGGPAADVSLCGPCAADLIDSGRADRLGPFSLVLGKPLKDLSEEEFDTEVERRHALRYPTGCPNGCEACYVRLQPPVTSAESQAYIDGGAPGLRAMREEVGRV